MNRLTDNDRNWGPFTLARWRREFSITLSSGDEEDTPVAKNSLRIIAFGWAIRMALPQIVQPHRVRHEANWDEATVKRLGRNHYFETHERKFGVSLSDMGNGYDFLQVKFGPEIWDSSTSKSWCMHLPWKMWDCVRHSIYEPDGTHYFTEKPKKWDEYYAAKQKCPTSKFRFKDYDGKEITAECIIEEREWHRGEGRFKWLRWFYRPMIRRDLDIRFSEEVGPGKGSWKGGTVGHSIEMLPGETPEQAFRRYCELGHSHKGTDYRLEYLGAVDKAA